MNERNISVKEISLILKHEFIGHNYTINGLNLCNRDSEYPSILSFITSEKYVDYLRNHKKVKAVFLTKELFELVTNELGNQMAFFIVENPEIVFYELHKYLYTNTLFYDHFGLSSKTGNNSHIHETALIEDGVIIGDNVVVGPRSIIRKGCFISNNVQIGYGSILGSEGFQLIFNKNKEPFLVKHVGGLIIGENVSIGDNCSVCNSLFEGYTSIGANSKIDNLVHIAHNCRIGKNNVITAGVILSGSTVINDNCWLAPNSTLTNRVVLEDQAFVGIGAVVINHVNKGVKVFGNPARPFSSSKNQ